MSKVDQVCSCPSKKRSRRNSTLPLLSGVLIALLPKCHFCVLAYSSAITLCSGAKIYQHSPVWTNFISIGLALFTVVMIAINFRGKRTWVALLLVLAGCFLIVRSELVTGALGAYHWGSILLLSGIWVNGSFYFFLKKLVNRISIYSTQV